MAGGSDARALATRLARLGPHALAALLAARGVPESAPWRDCFDAAEGLLDAASLDRALARLPRGVLRDLAARGASAGRDLAPLGLVGVDGAVLDAVTARVRALLTERPEAFAPFPVVPDPVPADHAATAVAAERAATATRILTDLVALSVDQPLGVTGAGAVTAVDRRRLIDRGTVADAGELDDLLGLAATAGLITVVDREWLSTVDADAWLARPLVERWAQVAAGWRGDLPAALRTASGGYTTPAGWRAVFPLDAEWPARADALLRRAERWGLYADRRLEPAWTAPLRRGDAADTAALAALLPAEIDRIYLQADLTAIAPGPLQAALDLRLRGMAVRESQAQASTYRFTAASLAAAVAGGEDAASIRAFLQALSLTGIPQPLQYLIDRAAARHGLVRVGDDPITGRTRVTSTDPQLLRTIAVDQVLRAIGLTEADGALTSRVSRDAVFWTLADAHYPVLAVDAAGAPSPVHRRRPPVAGSGAVDPADALLPLAETLLAGSTGDADAAWLARELDQAVRAHADVVITVRMPDGLEREFALEATGLGGGRLRGRDRGADIERTLPLSSIVDVRPR